MLKVFVQVTGSNGIHIIDVEQTLTVEAFLAQVRATGLADHSASHLFVEDTDAPVAAVGTLDEAGIKDNASVHVGRCVRIHVTVRYAGRPDLTRDFSPAQKIEQVFKWAIGKQGFDISNEDALDFALQVCGYEDTARADDHVGSVTNGDKCEVCFNLIPTDRIQG
jgi:hypothetical protein